MVIKSIVIVRNVCRRLWYRLVYIRYLCVFNFSMFSMCVLFTLFECGLFRQLEWQCVLFWHRILLNHGLNNLIVGISTAFKQIAKWSSSLCLIWMVRTVEHSLNAVILYCGGCLHYVFWKILICTMLFLCTNHDTLTEAHLPLPTYYDLAIPVWCCACFFLAIFTIKLLTFQVLLVVLGCEVNNIRWQLRNLHWHIVFTRTSGVL